MVEGESRGTAGVPREFELARQRGLPCFLLGGLGGAAAGYLRTHAGVLDNLCNGLDRAENTELAGEENVAALVKRVVGQLVRLPLVRGEKLGNSTFRILALDGGGIKGTFTAAVLAPPSSATLAGGGAKGPGRQGETKEPNPIQAQLTIST